MNFKKRRKVILSNSTIVSYEVVRRIVQYIRGDNSFELAQATIDFQDTTSTDKNFLELEVTVETGIVVSTYWSLGSLRIKFFLNNSKSNISGWSLEPDSKVSVDYVSGNLRLEPKLGHPYLSMLGLPHLSMGLLVDENRILSKDTDSTSDIERTFEKVRSGLQPRKV